MAPAVPESLAKSLEASKAEYVRLGNSGLRVSVPIFGTMSLGDKRTLAWSIEEEEVCFTIFLSLSTLFSESTYHSITLCDKFHI